MIPCKLLGVGALLALSFVDWSTVARAQEGAQPRSDVHGDPLPAGALARVGTVRWRHASRVVFADFLADGKTILTVDEDQIVHFWEFPTGKELRRFQADPKADSKLPRREPNTTAILSKDGKVLAVGAVGGTPSFPITVYDVATGKPLPLEVVKGLWANGRGYTLAPDGKTLANMDRDGTIRLLDCDGKHSLRELGKGPRVPPPGPDAVLVFSPDCKRLLVIHPGDRGTTEPELRIWDLATSSAVWSMKVIKSKTSINVAMAAFAPDGKAVALLDGDSTIKVLDADSGKVLAKGPTWVGGGGAWWAWPWLRTANPCI